MVQQGIGSNNQGMLSRDSSASWRRTEGSPCLPVNPIAGRRRANGRRTYQFLVFFSNHFLLGFMYKSQGVREPMETRMYQFLVFFQITFCLVVCTIIGHPRVNGTCRWTYQFLVSQITFRWVLCTECNHDKARLGRF